MKPCFLNKKDLKLVLFGGKGGTGKTTSSAAAAVHLALNESSKRILVVSTDPAHSLGDSFGLSIGDKITPIEGLKNLWGLEMNAPELFKVFKKRHGEAIKKIADRGTYFDQHDIADFFSLSLPGLDEVMAIIEVANIIKGGQYDLIILDTAPTGHTLRLLSLPEEMEKWVNVLNMMQEKHRYLMKHFTGRYVKDDADEFLETMVKDVKMVRSLLRDPRSTEFVPVTISEPMSILETERLLLALKGHGISVNTIIVNRIIEGTDCPFCLSKRKEVEKYIEEINKRFASYNLIKVPLFPYEIRGLKGLTEFARALFGKAHIPLPSHKKISEKPLITIAKMTDLLEKDLEFLIFGGKGGVGKTTMASVTALHIAKAYPDKKILIFSTDPAHSLSDSFGCPIGNKVTPIKGIDNLYAMEIDAARLLEDFKMEYREGVEALFDRFIGRGVDIKFDREVMTELVSLSPPGMDELMALKGIMDLRGEYDLFVLDTAPTGHLLRFLEVPDLVREWLKAIFRLLIKYKEVVRLTHLAERMLKLSRNIRMVQEVLIDSKKTELVTVTIPEAMGKLEMERLLSSLEMLKIPCRHILINMVIPVSDCGFCTLKSEEQQGYIQEINNMSPLGYIPVQVPLLPHQIRGVDALTELSDIVYGRQPVGVTKH